ncbi:MAG: hypothetical protein FWD42_03865 [Solirubrobacterales bacterium]|nr:hypothetical protein [Solirubrobacterales bacterium]
MRALATLGTLATCAALGAGCSTSAAPRVDRQELAEARTFPYFKIYWVGRTFAGQALTAADGMTSYNSAFGDSVYYGDCAHKGGLVGSSCVLPLQVTTVIYQTHSNEQLGAQRNAVIRGVPAAVYNEGRSIELYSGQLAIDVSSDNFADALRAADALRPLNAGGSARARLPLPVYCPDLYGPQSGPVLAVMDRLPGRACQLAAAAKAQKERLASG